MAFRTFQSCRWFLLKFLGVLAIRTDSSCEHSGYLEHRSVGLTNLVRITRDTRHTRCDLYEQTEQGRTASLQDQMPIVSPSQWMLLLQPTSNE